MKKFLLIIICIFITSTLSSCKAFESRFYFDSNEECFDFIEEILVYNEKYDYEFTYMDLKDDYTFVKEAYWYLISRCTHSNNLEEYLTCDCKINKYDFTTYNMFLTLEHPYLSHIIFEYKSIPSYDNNEFSNITLDNCDCYEMIEDYNTHYDMSNVKYLYEYKPSSKFKNAIPQHVESGFARAYKISSINYNDQIIFEATLPSFNISFLYKEQVPSEEEHLNFEREIVEYCLNNQKTIILNPSAK